MANENQNQIVLSANLEQVAEQLNNSVLSVIGQETMNGFQKAFLIANAIDQLKGLLTPEYMKPIMALQGNKLGFKSDRVYPEDVVKNCLIEAVLFGLQPFGNQFNIIAGNVYATKEGCGHLLSKIPGLSYSIIPELPRIKDQSAAVMMNIEWSMEGVKQSKKYDVAVRLNAGMGTDAAIGKATRKARKWLYDTITGSELPEGDVVDADYTTVSSRQNKTVADVFSETTTEGEPVNKDTGEIKQKDIPVEVKQEDAPAETEQPKETAKTKKGKGDADPSTLFEK